MLDFYPFFLDVLRIVIGVVIGSVVGGYIAQKLFVRTMKNEIMRFFGFVPKDLKFYATLIKTLMKEVLKDAEKT